jgi:hypothetical protein
MIRFAPPAWEEAPCVRSIPTSDLCSIPTIYPRPPRKRGGEVACSFWTTQGNQPARPSSHIATATLTSPVLSAPMENVVRESGLMQNEKGNQSWPLRTQRYL